LVVGGADALTGDLYDPATRTWTVTSRLVEPRTCHAAVLLDDGRVLVVGGTDDSGQFVVKAELYDPQTERWTAAGRPKQPTGNQSLTRLADGRVLMAGGSNDLDGASALSSTELYDPTTGRWTTAKKMSTGRSAHKATLLPDGRVLVVGGAGPFVSPTEPVSLASAELYDPVSGRWTDAGDMSERRFDHTMTLLPDGRVLVTGGSPGFGAESAAVELYDPARNAWATLSAMGKGRYQHTATILEDGRVLVAGGLDEDDAASASVELYDATKGSWSAGPSMVEARIRHTATLLRDGTVLVAGNEYGDMDPTAAELFDPGSGG
jgi:N-acetylneuraminic acid mutarotase